jgi:DsbC/DsbD-like thiol-disulfide interchange protein
MSRLVLVLLACLCRPAGAQEADPIHWKTTTSRIQAKAGALIRVPLSAAIDMGWHLYSLKKLEGGPVPTTITVAAGRSFKLDGEIESSDPIPMNDSQLGMTVELYVVKADFVLPVRIASDASAGPHTLKVSVRYQTCSEKICLPPKTVTIEAPVTVSR